MWVSVILKELFGCKEVSLLYLTIRALLGAGHTGVGASLKINTYSFDCYKWKTQVTIM